MNWLINFVRQVKSRLRVKHRLRTLFGIDIPERQLQTYFVNSYSQEGEDMILGRIFERQPVGYYVDVGAHHPERFSNTYFFYLRGWSGINIDAMPGSMEAFKKIRPRDVNLEIPISNTNEFLTYYIFNEPAVNTLSAESANQSMQNARYHILSEVQLQTLTLKQVLEENLPNGQQIDFLSIDVEGLDFQVILSNDWIKYRPVVILVENLGGGSANEALQSDVSRFLKSKNYEMYCKTCNTLIFRSRQVKL